MPISSRHGTALAATAALTTMALGLAACGTGVPGSSLSGVPSGALTVFAAASMKPTFEGLQATFEAAHPATKITFNFAGSQELATQIVEGAKPDVFVSANDTQMAVVTGAGLNSGEPKVFATNKLMIAVPTTNPAGIKSFADLTKPGVKLVVCAPAVPCGAATKKVETATGVKLKPVSEEQAVTNVLTKVQTGEADAGLVYATDVIAAHGTVVGIAFPQASKAINRNVIVVLKGAPNAAAGQAWRDLVLSAVGQQVFAAAGFGTPE